MRCPSCGEDNPERARFCLSCAAPLITGLPSREVRKTVTVVFSDLRGSTSLGERLDTETLREVLTVYFAEMQAVLERHGGRVEKFIGDAIMAVFGLPTVHEDDALRAVRAAHEMQEALSKVNTRLEATWGVRLENRTGVNTGEVVAGDVSAGQHLVTGDTVNTAARLEQACPPLEVLIAAPTYRLVKDAVEVEEVAPLELKGKAERVRAYRLRSVRGGEAVTRRLDALMVGREDELWVLTDTLDRAVERRRPQLVTVLGPAGVGNRACSKSSSPPQRIGLARSEGVACPTGTASPFGHSRRLSGRRPGSSMTIRWRRHKPNSTTSSAMASPTSPSGWPRRSACPGRCSPSRRPSLPPVACSRCWRPMGRSSS